MGVTSVSRWRLLLLALLMAPATSSALCPDLCSCYVSGNMRVANCIGKNLETLPVRGSESLDSLLLSHNRLTQLPAGALAEFSGIHRLDLSRNFIKEVEPGSLVHLPWLQRLDLSFNMIHLRHSLPARFLATSGVKLLSLAGNGHIGKELAREDQVNINFSSWLEIPSLQTLNLSGCHLTRLPPWLINGLPGLETLDISSNELMVLPLLTLVSVCRIKNITLEKNLWDCAQCENHRSKIYLNRNNITSNTLCKSHYNKNCDLDTLLNEKSVKLKCLSLVLPEPLVYHKPKAVVFYVIMYGCVVLFLFVALIIVFKFLCSKFIPTRKINEQVI